MNGLRWVITYCAYVGVVIGGVVALAGAVNGKLGWAVVGAAIAVAGVLWLRRLPTWTPRPGGPGSDL